MEKRNIKKKSRKFVIGSIFFLISYYIIVNRYIDPTNSINIYISNLLERYKARIEAKLLKPITPNGNCRIVNTIEAIKNNYYIALGYAVGKDRFPHQWAVKDPEKANIPEYIIDKSVDYSPDLIYEPKVILKLESRCKVRIIKSYPMDKYTKWLITKGITYTAEFCKVYRFYRN